MAAVTMNSQMTCILPPELIPLVLSNLGKTDLLTCRLTCKSWNSECLKILRASDWKLKLNHENIEDYVKFLQMATTPQCVLPLQLSFEFYTCNWDALTDDEDEDAEPQWFGTPAWCLMDPVKSLFAILGENCIKSFEVADNYCLGGQEDMDYDDEDEDGTETSIGFMELLALISEGLEEMNLRDLYVELGHQDIDYIVNHFRGGWMGIISLPNLKSFISHKERSRERVKFPDLFNRLMMDCPNLRNLDIDLGENYKGDINRWNIPLTTLETLTIRNFKPTLPFLQKIEELKPRLREFDISDSAIQTDEEGMLLVSILTCISSTLESLKLTVGPNVSLTLPVMKKLKHLEWLKKNNPVFQNINQITFNSVTFPSLESLEIGIDLEDEMKEPIFSNSRLPDFPNLKHFTIHSKSNYVTWVWDSKPIGAEKMSFDLSFFYTKQTTIFQNVTEVELNCMMVNGEGEPDQLQRECLEENVKQFNLLFPVATKLSIQYPPNGYDKAENYFVGLLKRFLLSIHDDGNLKEIIILNSERNFLGYAIKELLCPPRIILENLERHPGLVELLTKAWKEYGFEKIGARAEVGVETGNTILQDLNGFDRSLKVFNGIESIRMLPGWRPYAKLESNLDFTLIARHFPNLRHLSIPAEWFMSDDENVCAKQVQNIRQLFPAGINIERVDN